MPLYTSKMKSKDLFLKILVPGLGITESQLSFSSVSSDSFLNADEISKAYLFSRLVDGLLSTGEQLSENGSSLSYYYLNNPKLNSQIIVSTSRPNNFPPTLLSSAKEGNTFCLTLLNPASFNKDSTWIRFVRNATNVETAQVDNITIQAIIPLYNLSMSICSLKIERPWFDADYALKNFVSLSNPIKEAYIEKIIFAKNVKVENFSTSRSEMKISKNGHKRKKVISHPACSIEISGTVIIGYIYRLL